MTARAGRQQKIFVVPRPFLKWAGGKGQLLPQLLARVDGCGGYARYHEPFVGGGALYFEMFRTDRLGGSAPYLSDSNDNLIATYRAIQQDVEAVIALLQEHGARHSEAFFYQLRAQEPVDLTERAARVIYLNKSCFNGLYRENASGKFNTPWGKYVAPIICDAENLRAVAAALADVRLEARPFETVLDCAKPGDFVYFDPPYHPVSKTANFTAYAKGRFGEDQQRRLAEVYRELDAKGVKVLLSNSMTPLVCELYRGFEIDEVLARRSVNSNGDGRGKVAEALVRNFPLDTTT